MAEEAVKTNHSYGCRPYGFGALSCCAGRYLVQEFIDNLVLTTSLMDEDLTVRIARGPPVINTIKDLNSAADSIVTTSNINTNSGVLRTDERSAYN